MSMKDSFVKVCNELYDDDKLSLENSYSAYNISIEKEQQELIDILRDRDILLMKINALKSRDTMREWIESEYDTLLATPYVNSIIIETNKIVVLTNTITITYGGRSYSIGKFRIELSDIIVAIDCNTYIRRSFASDSEIVMLLNRHQYVTAFQLVIDRLLTYEKKKVTVSPSYGSMVNERKKEIGKYKNMDYYKWYKNTGH